MNISLKKSYGFELIFEADNVRIVEDIEERIYTKNSEGKFDYKIPPKRDVQTECIEQFTNILQDLIYYRNAEFDSSDLIESLFEKLPKDKAVNLANKLKDDYYSDEE